MKKTLLWVVVLTLLATSVPLIAAAQEDRLASVGVNFHGYYRVRYDNFFDLSWASPQQGDDSDYWSWIDQRMILQPTLQVTDSIQIVMEMDFLNNVMFGDNDLVTEPTVVTQRKPNDLETIDNVRYDELRFLTGSVFSNQTSDTGTDGTQIDPINIRQLYMRVQLPIGTLTAGRQSDHWGMGLFSNSGSPYDRFMEPIGSINDRNSGFDGDGGDYYDSVSFGSRVAGFYYPRLEYARIAEDSFKTGENDVHGVKLVNEFRDIAFADSGRFDSGFFIQNRSQHATAASIWVYDLWLRLGYAGFSWEAEGLGVQGTANFVDRQTVRDLEENGLPTGERGGTVSAGAYLGATRFKYDSGRWGAGLESGFSSPADANPDNEFDADAAAAIAQAQADAEADPDNAAKQIDFVNAVVTNQSAFGRGLNAYPFDPNFNIDLITWDKLMGGQLENGVYVKGSGFVRPLDGMFIGLDVINSYVNEAGRAKNGTNASHDLGWEVDVNFATTFHKHFTWDAQFGYMVPGMWFRDSYKDVSNVYTLQMRAIVDF